MTDHPMTRRRALGAAIGGLSLPVLAACGSGNHASSNAGSNAGSKAGSSQAPSGGGNAPAPSVDSLVSTTQVPVGGGVILADQNVVVTQPQKGTFAGFSATCTHQGCILASVAGGTINCGCHGSQFSISSGANVTGPMGSPAGSVAPLPKVPIKVQGANVVKT